jgi:tight adherence protein B
MQYMIVLFIFLAVFFAFSGVKKIFSTRDVYKERLESVVGKSQQIKDGEKLTVGVAFKATVSSVSALFAARSFTAQLQARLVTAGIPLKGEEYITISLGAIILLPILTFIVSANFWLAVVVLVLAMIGPWMYITIKKDKRLHSFEMQLADSLVIMANALRAGFGFQQAMETVVKEMPPPISTEFEWCLREMNLGFNQEESLLHLGERVNSEELDMVISGIIIQKQVGGNLAHILDNIGDTMRDRARIKKQVKVLTAQGKMSGLVVGLLPVVLLAAMLVINPEHIYFLFQDSRGLAMLGTAIVMEIVGAYVISRIVNIEF